MTTIDVIAHNAQAWDNHVKNASQWTVPVSHEEIEAARAGLFSILLTAKKPVPRDWFPQNLAGLKILCLACGGGQQAPILAAAGADVTVFDNSLAQLTQDRLVSQRENLPLKIVRGDMRDLSAFADSAFDLVFCPVSVTYIPQVQPVFDEAYRVAPKKAAAFCSAPPIRLSTFSTGRTGIKTVLPYPTACRSARWMS